jgi:cytochrome P450
MNEILRMETPLKGYSRLVTRDYAMDEVTLPAGSRAIVFFGAANQDERKFTDPHRFDVTRNAAEQIAFGSGPHTCIGLHLAKHEMSAVFLALAKRARRFHLDEEVRNVKNTLRGFKRADRYCEALTRLQRRIVPTDSNNWNSHVTSVGLSCGYDIRS